MQLLGFLTFAQGGVGSGLLGNIGGVVGKAIWASFFMPLINGRKPWLGVSSGLQMLHVGLRGLNQTGMINLLTGGGIALLTYNFLTGNASPKNGMIGLVMFMISSKAAYMKSSILYKAASTLGETTAGPMSDTNTSAKRILAGAAVGSLLAILLSFSRISVICYLAGLLMLVAAIIIGINQRRGVTVT